MKKSISSHAIYYYISKKAGCDPCKTIYLCAPAGEAATEESAGAFAIRSGWQKLAEENAAVLVVPVVPNGWEHVPLVLLPELYKETRGKFETRSNTAIWGRSGKLWCWETILYLVGYEDGAVYAGNVLVRYPNMFAASALVNGAPSDYSAGELPSSHWLVPGAAADYDLKNRDIPVHLWMFQRDTGAAEAAASYFSGCYGICRETKSDIGTGAGDDGALCKEGKLRMKEEICTASGRMLASEVNPAWQLRMFFGSFSPENTALSRMILKE